MNNKIIALLISIFLYSNQGNAQNKNIIVIDGNKFFRHTVERGETLYSISDTYHVKTDAISKANVGIDFGLIVGDTILIPESKNKYILHTIEKNQTLYFLSKKYKIKTEEIIKINPTAKEGVKKGEVIKIPNIYYDPEPLLDTKVDSTTVPGDLNSVISYTDNPCNEYEYNSEVFKIAFMAPFYIEENKKINWYADEDVQYVNLYKGSDRFLELYMGFLMALDTLRKSGVFIDLYVYDTENNPDKVKEIISKQEFVEVDLIFGPIYPKNIEITAQVAKEHNINIISPLAQTTNLLADNQHLFQINPSIDTRLEELSHYLNKFENYNALIIHDNSEKDKQFINTLKQSLNPLAFFNDSVKVATYLDKKILPVKKQLNDTVFNLIIIPSTEEVFVTDLLRQLSILSHNYNFVVFVSNSIEKYDNIDLNYYKLLNINTFSSTNVNYQANEVIKFVNKYRKLFNNEPSTYTFQGYDAGLFFLTAMKKYGRQFQYCIKNGVCAGIQCELRFKQINDFGGYENKNLFILKYNKDFDQQIVDTTEIPVYIFEDKKQN